MNYKNHRYRAELELKKEHEYSKIEKREDQVINPVVANILKISREDISTTKLHVTATRINF